MPIDPMPTDLLMSLAPMPERIRAGAQEASEAPVDLMVAIPHMGPGGAQRVASLLLNHWHDRGVRIVLLTLFGKPDAHRLHPDILREDFIPEHPPDTPGPLVRAYMAVERALLAFHRWLPRLLRPVMWLLLPLLLLLRWLQRMRAKLLEFVPEDSASDGRGALAQTYFIIDGLLVVLSQHVPALLRPPVRLLRVPLRGLRRLRAKLLLRHIRNHPDRRTQRANWLRERMQAWRPRVVISFLGATNIQTLMAARGLGLKVLISERNDPAIQKLDEPWETLRPRVYPEADLVTANSAGALATMRSFVPESKLRQVANPLMVPSCPDHVERRQRRLIFVGRLVEQKAPEVLLDAFARAADQCPGWHLDVVGDGPLRASLESRATALGIDTRTTFHGHCADPYPLLYRASIFVLPSRFEGMPNAMLEAMGCGLAIIVSDASPGPLELIRDGETGLVAPVGDAGALAVAMRRLMTDADLRRRFADAASGQAEQMHLERVAAHWETLIRELGVELVASDAAVPAQ